MKYLYLSFALLFFACNLLKKTPPPPDSIDEDRLEDAIAFDFSQVDKPIIKSLIIDTLHGVLMGKENLTLKAIAFDNLDIVIDDEEDVILYENEAIFPEVKPGSIVAKKGPSAEHMEGAPPGIMSLIFKKLTVRDKEGNILKVFDEYETSRFNIRNWTKYSLFDISDPFLQQLYKDLFEIEDRLSKLMKMVQKKEVAFPDHAARDLPAELRIIEKRIKEIRAFHEDKIATIETIQVELSELESIHLTFDDMEEGLENENNNPISIANAILFTRGEYKINTQTRIEKLDIYILENIVPGLEEKLADLPKYKKLKLILAITGYADDLDILASGKLERELCNLSSVRPCPPRMNKQAVLNQILSEQRAKNVYQYIEKAILKKYGESISIQADPLGKGRTYPPDIRIGTCQGDCERRRITTVSGINYRIDE